MLNGIVMLGKAGDIIEEAERRKSQDSSLDSTLQDSKSTNKTLSEELSKPFSNSPFKSTKNIFSNSTANNLANDILTPNSKEQNVAAASDVKKEFADNVQNCSVLSSTPKRNSSNDATNCHMEQNSLFATPANTPTHLIKRTKRVRLDSGAQVQEIEPYSHYCELSDNERTDGLHLPLSSLAANSDLPSPASYDSSSASFGHGGLMTNSMVNLASVGLNQGPQTPDGESQDSRFSSLRSSCASLSTVDVEVDKDGLRPSSCPSAEYREEKSNGEDDVKEESCEELCKSSFKKCASAPDVRIDKEEDSGER